MSKTFLSNEFDIPTLHETDKIRIRALTVNDVIKDYDAVMSSIDHLHGVFGPKHNRPTKELTLEQDLIDLGRHQKEFQRRSSFAYTVMNLDESECVGCMYIYPTNNDIYHAMIVMRVRESELKNGLDKHLYETINHRMKSRPFKNIAYPGRDMTREEWYKIND